MVAVHGPMEELDTPVDEVMTDRVRTVDATRSVREAADVFAAEGIGSVVVEWDGGRGILTKTDIVAGISDGVDPNGAAVSELMSTPVVTVDRGADLQEAVDRMGEEGIKRLVVTGAGEPVGMLTTTDLVAELSPDLDRIVEMFTG
jgi:predicted transcriptional regulator